MRTAMVLTPQNVWWDDEKIEATVTRQFVCSKLLPEEIERLDRVLSFGDGLTDGTYWEWIDQRAKRLFLILWEIGVPDQIFGIIDDSWEDEDLPIALDQVERLELTASKDDKIEKKFYYRQFHYLLRHINKGEHVVYHEAEVVPIDERHHSVSMGDRVTLPKLRGEVFCRRKIRLGTSQGCMPPEEFLYEVNSIRNVQNDHLVSYWASYTHRDEGYILFKPSSDYNLKNFLTTTPASFKNMEKADRRLTVMNWINCLVDTLCFLHSRGLSHGNIRPSNILFNNANHIFYADFTRLNPDPSAVERGSFDKEAYDYAAPEQWFRPTAGSTSPVHRKATLSGLSSSPDNLTFNIARSAADYNPNSPVAMLHTPNPHLNPQTADIFSLGCIILELLSFLLKKPSRSFAQHRAAKHKTPGRGGAVLDSSFHKNLGQVETWMTQLAKEAVKKEDAVFRGVVPALKLVARMLSADPAMRPSAYEVQSQMYRIITESCQIHEPHCVHQYGGFDFGISSLRLAKGATATGGGSGGEGDTLSISTKRSSAGSASGLVHRRTNSSTYVGSSAYTTSAPPSSAVSSGSGTVVGADHHSHYHQKHHHHHRSSIADRVAGKTGSVSSSSDGSINGGYTGHGAGYNSGITSPSLLSPAITTASAASTVEASGRPASPPSDQAMAPPPMSPGGSTTRSGGISSLGSGFDAIRSIRLPGSSNSKPRGLPMSPPAYATGE